MFVKKGVLAILLLSAVLFSAGPAAAMAQPSVDITISGLDVFDLAVFDLNVNYDDSLLTFSSYELTETLGSFTGPDPSYPDAEDWSEGDGFSGTVDNGFVAKEGSIHLAVNSYLYDFSSQPDTFTLATIYFNGDYTALDNITLSNIILGDEYGDPISFTVGGTNINVVPIPGAAWLMVSGLLGYAGLRRRKRS